MGSSRALTLLRGLPAPSSAVNHRDLLHRFSRISSSEVLMQKQNKRVQSYSAKCSLEPPDLTRLAQTAHISLTPTEIEEFAPKIKQVLDWFGQLQAVDLESVEPAVRAGTDVGTFREDLPETFENREAMIAAVPNYDEPFINVPKVLKQE